MPEQDIDRIRTQKTTEKRMSAAAAVLKMNALLIIIGKRLGKARDIRLFRQSLPRAFCQQNKVHILSDNNLRSRSTIDFQFSTDNFHDMGVRPAVRRKLPFSL